MPTRDDYRRWQLTSPTLPTSLAGIQAAISTPTFQPAAQPMPEVPTLQSVDVARPEQSDYNYFQNLTDQYLEKPISQEEQDRRARAASAVSGIGALGNALSAFSNIAFTGGVAPSQALPDTYSPSKDIEAFRNRVNRVRENYLRGQMAAHNYDRNEYERDRDYWLKGVDMGNRNAMQMYNAAMQRYGMQQQQANADRDFGYKKERDKIKDAMVKDQFEEQKRQAKNREALGWANYNLSKQNAEENRKNRLAVAALRSGGTGTGSLPQNMTLPMWAPDSTGQQKLTHVGLNPNAVNEQTLGWLRSVLPNEGDNNLQYEFDNIALTANEDPKKVKEGLLRVIGMATSDPQWCREHYQELVDIGLINSGQSASSGLGWGKKQEDNGTDW